MRKRLLLSAAALIAIACVVLLVLARLPPRPGVTKANFDRIEVGMSRDEVKKIFGEAASSPKWVEHMTSSHLLGERWGRSDEVYAVVVFDPWQHRIVTETEWRDHRLTLAQRIRIWLRLP